jgi:hypothetical protein
MEQRMLLIIKRLSGNDLAIRARKNDQITYQTGEMGPRSWAVNWLLPSPKF